MNTKSKVFIANTDEFNCYSALKRAFNSLGVNLDFKNVAIKLNLCSLKVRETGATSDPIVVEQLVRLFNENNIQVRLVESNSGSKDADLAFAYLGFKKLEKKYDVKCVNLSRDDFLVKKVDGYHFKSVKVPKTIDEADFFITHPKLKTHSSMKVRLTGALKNQFGCLMTTNKATYHNAIHEVIADINQILAPDMAIVDGIIAMTGYGPTDGIPQRLNLLIASRDLVATDSLIATLFGYNPRAIKYIKLASRKGLGVPDSILVGDKMKTVCFNMHISSLIIRSFELLSAVGITSLGE